MLVEELANIIFKVVDSENSVLSDIANEGIFFMPELALAYECGKQITMNSEKIFGKNLPVWIREKNLGNGGPTDLLFELRSGHSIAIEFKLRGTSNAYIKDIVKLSKLNSDTLKLFCSLVDVFDSKLPDDGRQQVIEQLNEHQVRPILKKHFSTKQNWYSSDVSCVVCIWSIGAIPEIQT